MKQGVEKLTRVPADVEEEEVRHRRLGNLHAQGLTRLQELGPAFGGDLPPAGHLGVVAETGQRGILSRLIEVERVPNLADRLDDIVGADPVPDPKPREPVDLRERPEDQHPSAVPLQVLLDPIGIPGLVDVLEVRLVENRQDVIGHALEVRIDGGTTDHRAGRVVRVAEVDELGSWRHRGKQRLRVITVLGELHPLRVGSHLDRPEHVARKRRPSADDLVIGIEDREREVADDAVGAGRERHLGEIDAVTRCQRFPQTIGAAVRVAVQVPGPPGKRLERAREGPELALVRCELHDAVEPELPLDLLDGLAGLIRHEVGDGGTNERILGHVESLEGLRYLNRRDYALRMDEIGLFPLELVLLPGEQRPLHIFEPRYRELIGECLETGDQFGLVLADEDGLREIGTRAAVVEVLEHFDDGRLNVVIEGGERFRLLELTEGHSYATAEVDDLEDEVDSPTEDERARVLAAYDKVVEAAQAELDELDPATESLAFEIGARIELGNEIKQDLLELRSERERVVRLEPILTRAAEAVLRERTVRERASGNGRVEPVP